MSSQSWLLTEAEPDEEARKSWWRRLPPPTIGSGSLSDPSKYRPPPGLTDALNAALILGQPLLLTGEPGCGKTDAAHYLAYRLGLDHGAAGRGGDAARRFDVKSTTAARDMFYSFDVIGRFYAAQTGGDTSAVKYLTLNALGRAIFEASQQAEADELRAQLVPDASADTRRSVVLIDEIDKAPRDVPNDLLVEMDKLRFYVAEIDRTFSAAPEHRPIVVLTSNRERDLPDAFLRRCIVFSMPFPSEADLRIIARDRVPSASAEVVDDAVKVTLGLRSANVRRKPGTAELLSFIAAFVGSGLAESGALRGRSDWYQLARTTLLKNTHDHDAITNAVMAGYLTA